MGGRYRYIQATYLTRDALYTQDVLLALTCTVVVEEVGRMDGSSRPSFSFRSFLVVSLLTTNS